MKTKTPKSAAYKAGFKLGYADGIKARIKELEAEAVDLEKRIQSLTSTPNKP